MSAIEVHTFKVSCPYCNQIWTISTKHRTVDQHRMNVYLCDLDEDGCDKYFGYKLDIKVQSESYKIEGEQ